MKLKMIFICLSLVFAISCNKDEEESIDPIVGTWYLVKHTIDGSSREMTECSLQNNLVFAEDKKVTFNSHTLQDGTSNCEFQTWNETWVDIKDGNYGVYSGSLFIQERGFKLRNSQLTYFLESWEFTDDGIVTSDVELIYEKQ